MGNTLICFLAITTTMIEFAVTYMASGKNQQHPPGRDQHLGLREVTDAFLLQLRHVAH